jgi:NAD(P)-dependent dehydrogenase (short-subunit alcohol dehydrogenase family)
MATILVTGANRGIGLELVRRLRERGDEVIAVCRRATDELRATGARVIDGIDVADGASIGKLADAVGDAQLDVLVNNAGLLETDGLANLDVEGIRRQFEVNALGPLRVTAALQSKVKDGGKIAMITSRMGSIADNGSGGSYGYRMSKAALNMAGVSLARDLAGRKIAVVLLHPGMVATDMTARFGNPSGMQRPDETAGKLVARIDALTLAQSGSFQHANGETLPW